jgi:hypothetical protein
MPSLVVRLDFNRNIRFFQLGTVNWQKWDLKRKKLRSGPSKSRRAQFSFLIVEMRSIPQIYQPEVGDTELEFLTLQTPKRFQVPFSHYPIQKQVSTSSFSPTSFG